MDNMSREDFATCIRKFHISGLSDESLMFAEEVLANPSGRLVVVGKTSKRTAPYPTKFMKWSYDEKREARNIAIKAMKCLRERPL